MTSKLPEEDHRFYRVPFLLLVVACLANVAQSQAPSYPGYPDVYYGSSTCIFVKVKNASEGVATFCSEHIHAGSQIIGSQTTQDGCLSEACKYTDADANALNLVIGAHCYIRLCTPPLTDSNLLLGNQLGGRDIWIRVIDYCSSNPCQNGGTCTNLLPRSYECICPPGYIGNNCETKMVICSAAEGTEVGCSNTTCQWNSQLNDCYYASSSVIVSNDCTYVKLHSISDGFASLCTGGFTQGSSDTQQCVEGACNHGASNVNAINHRSGSSCYYRQCATHSNGTISDLQLTQAHGGRDIWIISLDHCTSASSPCQNGGTCYNTEYNYQCKCPPGYQGTTCLTDINECASNPCQNGGSCEDKVNAFQCSCSSGYEGVVCAQVTASSDSAGDAAAQSQSDTDNSGAESDNTATIAGATVGAVVSVGVGVAVVVAVKIAKASAQVGTTVAGTSASAGNQSSSVGNNSNSNQPQSQSNSNTNSKKTEKQSSKIKKYQVQPQEEVGGIDKIANSTAPNPTVLTVYT